MRDERRYVGSSASNRSRRAAVTDALRKKAKKSKDTPNKKDSYKTAGGDTPEAKAEFKKDKNAASARMSAEEGYTKDKRKVLKDILKNTNKKEESGSITKPKRGLVNTIKKVYGANKRAVSSFLRSLK